MTEYENKDSGYLYPNKNKRDDGEEDSFGRLWVGTTEHKIKSWLSDAGDHMDLKFQKTGTRGDNEGHGHMDINTGTGDNVPKWKGMIKTARGQRFEVAGWIKSRDGKPPLLSLKLKLLEETGKITRTGEDETNAARSGWPL